MTLEAEDRPPPPAGEKEQVQQTRLDEDPEAGGDNSPDTDGSTRAQAQAGRVLTCLQMPDFLQADAAEGSGKTQPFWPNLLYSNNGAYSSVCVREDVGMKEGKKQKKRKKNKHMKKQQVPAEMTAEPELAKYWAQRYRLFSRFDEGIRLDRGQDLLEPSILLVHKRLISKTFSRFQVDLDLA